MALDKNEYFHGSTQYLFGFHLFLVPRKALPTVKYTVPFGHFLSQVHELFFDHDSETAFFKLLNLPS